MTKKREILIGIGTGEDQAKSFVSAWKRAKKGLAAERPINRLHFADTATLFKYLSPKRFELLQQLHAIGPLSIRKLATELHRDYKNVHTDVKELQNIGLIEETRESLFVVPWDVIITELQLMAKAT